jgi:menaquinone-specific isochorismate synthase
LTQIVDNKSEAKFLEAKKQLTRRVQEALGRSGDTAPLFHRIAVSLPEHMSPLVWLGSQDYEQKIYWADRNNSFETASIGESASFAIEDLNQRHILVEKLEELLKRSTDGIRFYGGMRFPSEKQNDTNSSDWQHFGAGKFVLPRFELIREHGQTQFVCNLNAETDVSLKDTILSELKRVNFETTENELTTQPFELRTDLPLFDGWQSNVQAILDDFTKSKIEKIVLARQSIFEFKENCDAQAIIGRLTESTPNCFHYLFQPVKGTSFIGASPELLYKRVGREIASEAVAGTRRRGRDDMEDDGLGRELLSDEKEKREHQYVVDNIKAALDSICQTLKYDQTESLFKLARVQHLLSRFNGTLRDDATDSAILSLLHPTSAVGGFPSDIAQKRISECEPFDRGWYAGAIGWLAKDAAEFAVGIRSGLVNGKKLSLYSGAGIVKGSVPKREWDEIESKIGSFLNAVTG